MGYCPQFDALIDQMTVRETLKMYGRLRGINETDLTQAVENMIQSLLLEAYASIMAGNLRFDRFYFLITNLCRKKT